MRMNIDKPRRHHQPRRINRFRPSPQLPNRRDLPIANPHVRIKCARPGSIDNSPAFDDEIEISCLHRECEHQSRHCVPEFHLETVIRLHLSVEDANVLLAKPSPERLHFFVDFPDFITLAFRQPDLRFMVIGGYAVGAWGHVRPTRDTDFLVRDADRPKWKELAAQGGLRLVNEANVFAQFVPVEGEALDLMLVNDETFEKLWAESIMRDVSGHNVRVPSLDHLIALKVHALKQGLSHRTFKDAEDVEKLARANNLNLAEPRYEEIFLKYGTREIYETLIRVLRH
jgi:hypothetical protein